MSIAMRVVLVWWLALAVPVQAAATAAMLHCGAAQTAHDHAAHGHAGAGASTEQVDHAEHSAQAPATGESSAGCSACASCCSAAALPSAETALTVLHQAAAALAPPARGVEPVIGDGIERPPRSCLA